MARWNLNSIDFVINPDSVSFDRGKNIHTIEIIDAAPVIQEGRDAPPTMSASGWVLTKAVFTQFNSWYETGGILTLIDDLGDTYTVIISSLKLDRRRYASNNTVYYFTIDFHIITGL